MYPTRLGDFNARPSVAGMVRSAPTGGMKLSSSLPEYFYYRSWIASHFKLNRFGLRLSRLLSSERDPGPTIPTKSNPHIIEMSVRAS